MEKEEALQRYVGPIRGWLTKQGHSTFGKGWKRRYFMLTLFADALTIYYFKKEVVGELTNSKEKPVGCIRLQVSNRSIFTNPPRGVQ